MNTPTKITDYVSRGIARLTSLFRDKQRISTHVSVNATQTQELENAAFAFLSELLISNIAGIPIDDIYGKILVESRQGASDANYTAILGVKVLLNRSCGEPWRMVAILKGLTSSTTVVFLEYYPASIIMTFDLLNASEDLVRNRMLEAKLGGVRLDLVYAPTGSFIFSSVASHVTGSSTGLGIAGLTGIGGKLARVL